MNKPLLYTDLPIPTCPEDLIGRVFPCPSPGCGLDLEIGSSGVEHYGYRHMLRYSLEDLFEILTWEREHDRRLFGFAG